MCVLIKKQTNKQKQKRKGFRISNFTLLFVVFKRLHGSERVRTIKRAVPESGLNEKRDGAWSAIHMSGHVKGTVPEKTKWSLKRCDLWFRR